MRHQAKLIGSSSSVPDVEKAEAVFLTLLARDLSEDFDKAFAAYLIFWREGAHKLRVPQRALAERWLAAYRRATHVVLDEAEQRAGAHFEVTIRGDPG